MLSFKGWLLSRRGDSFKDLRTFVARDRFFPDTPKLYLILLRFEGHPLREPARLAHKRWRQYRKSFEIQQESGK